MSREFNVNIRKFENKDRGQLRSISHDTAFMGQPASLFFENREVICDALNSYFTDYEPESCFIAEVDSKVIGYLIGAKSKIVAERVFKDKIMLRLFWKAVKSGVFIKKKNIAFIFSCFKAFLKGGLDAPDFTKEYPATFHINISKEYRGQSVGTALIKVYLNYLKQSLVPGVHLATISQAGADFFSRQSFRLLYEGKRSYFRHVLHKDVPLFIFGKKLVTPESFA
ncbi:MAG: GNAT family N-acetyltransferase [Candidatus Omnitrophica bacterium]|nr:GNAT family N-acetyltransferase [Candidatus Omnitrophota bacterium]MDD5690777.1 GNAT family N-acetyltransferase [Candidatus Omnitrophota bacterium]